MNQLQGFIILLGKDQIIFKDIYTPVVNVKFLWETFQINLSKGEKQAEVRYKHSLYKVLADGLCQN